MWQSNSWEEVLESIGLRKKGNTWGHDANAAWKGAKKDIDRNTWNE